jgi:hypothetical protein
MLPEWAKILYLILLAGIIGITSWAIATPFLQISDSKNNKSAEIFVYQQCVNGVCDTSTSPLVAKLARSLFALYITLIVLCLIAGALMMGNLGKWRKKVFAFIVLMYAIILALIFSARKQQATEIIPNTTSNYNLTASSITMIVMVCVTFWPIISQYRGEYGFFFYDLIFLILP